MPSCVVKVCKNNSTSHKKCQGITFHRFPKDNEPWKRDWIEYIRNSRGEKDWMPSSTSVICSAHFNDEDFYLTKMGLRRILTFAVPKQDQIKTECVTEPTTSLTENGGSSQAQVNIQVETSAPHFTVVKIENDSDAQRNNDDPLQIRYRTHDLQLELQKMKNIMKKKDDKLKFYAKINANLKRANSHLAKRNRTLKKAMAKLKCRNMLLERKAMKNESDEE